MLKLIVHIWRIKMKLHKKAIAWYYIVGMILGLIILAVMLYMAFVSQGKIHDIIGQMKDWFV